MRTVVLSAALAGASLLAGPKSYEPSPADVRTTPTERRAPRPVETSSRQLPCDFEENLGQTAAEVDFLARCSGYVAFLTGGAAVILSGDDAFRIELEGGRRAPPAASAPRPGRTHSLVGGDARRLAGIPRYGRVEYRDVLPGVDVSWRIAGRRVAFDLLLDAGVDPQGVELRLDGIRWAGPDETGGLSIGLPSGGTARLSAPRAWQGEGGGRRDVDVAFARGSTRDRVRFRVGEHDPGQPLVIDPSLTVSTRLGGSATEATSTVRTDASGSIYLAGFTTSTDFPATTGAFRTTKGDASASLSDGYVAKLDATGTSVEWVTYLGGNGTDWLFAMDVGASGEVVVGGYTSSTDFPLKSAYQSTAANGFLAKLDASGASLAWSTYFTYRADHLGLDSSGNVHAFDTGSKRAFAFDGTGSTLLHSKSINAFSPPEFSFGAFAVEPSGAVWLGGSVDGSGTGNLGTSGAYRTTYAGGSRDGWLVRLDTSGSEVYRTYLGGSGTDRVRALALAADGDLLVLGDTNSTNFPLVGAHQSSVAGGEDLFVTKLDFGAAALEFSTYLGGSATDFPRGIVEGPGGSVFVTGETNSGDFPTADAFQATYAGNYDVFIAEFESDGTLARSTYLGGAGVDYPTGIAVSEGGRPLVLGTTASSDFPLACAHQTEARGSDDAFLSGVAGGTAMGPDTGPVELPGATVGRAYSQQLAISGGDEPLTWSLHSGTLPEGLSLSSSGLLSGTPGAPAEAALFVKIRDANEACTVREFRVMVSPAPSLAGSALPPWTVGRPYSEAVPVEGGTAPFTWSLVSGDPPTGTSLSSAGVLSGTPSATGTFAFDVDVTDANGAAASGTVSVVIHAAPSIEATSLAPWTTLRPYERTPVVTGGTPPFVWTLVSGALPVPGGLDPTTGVITGTAGPVGDYAFTLRATDAAGAAAQAEFTARIHAPPTIPSAFLPIAAAGRPYSARIASSGGTSPLRWSIVSGSFGAGFTGVDAATGAILGTPVGTAAGTAEVEVEDAAGATGRRSLRITVAPVEDLARGKAADALVIAEEASGVDDLRWLELLAGTRLDVEAKLTHENLFAVDLLLFDAAGTPIDLGPWSKRKDPVVAVRAFPVPATGRYLLVVRQPKGFLGNVRLRIAARPPAGPRGRDALGGGTSAIDVPFSALPGSKLTVAAAAARRSGASPTIVSLKDAAGTELLDPEDVRRTRRTETLRASAPLVGGDYVVTISTDGGTSGDVEWSVKLKAPKGYAFSLPDLPVTGE